MPETEQINLKTFMKEEVYKETMRSFFYKVPVLPIELFKSGTV